MTTDNNYINQYLLTVPTMPYTGFVLRDLSGYEWAGDCLRARNHAAILKWSNSQGPNLLSVPEGFERYDPLDREPALFQRAARIPFGDNREIRSLILAFANRWGDIQLSPDHDGTIISIWNNSLQQIRSLSALPVTVSRNSQADWPFNLLTSNLNLRYHVVREFGQLHSSPLVMGLFSSLVVQAVEALISRAEFIDCKFCGAPFSVTGSREGKIFCGDSCRVQEYKRRKKTAIEMRKVGCKLRDISTATNTPISQIKTWIGE
jgi:hypothetical protein